jgi:hypothetical protein
MKSCIFAAALIAAVQASNGYGGYGNQGYAAPSSYGTGSGYGAPAAHGSGYGHGVSKGYGGYTKVDYVPHTKVVQKAAEKNAASKAAGTDYQKTMTTDWDAWGRDQDLAIDESYGATRAKSYRAESYDEWDNEDKDDHGAQAWGKDKDAYGASSQDYDASDNDYAKQAKAYAGHAQGSYGAVAGHNQGSYAHQAPKGYGHGHGAHGAHGKGHSAGHASAAHASTHGAYGKSYGGEAYGAQDKMTASW